MNNNQLFQKQKIKLIFSFLFIAFLFILIIYLFFLYPPLNRMMMILLEIVPLIIILCFIIIIIVLLINNKNYEIQDIKDGFLLIDNLYNREYITYQEIERVIFYIKKNQFYKIEIILNRNPNKIELIINKNISKKSFNYFINKNIYNKQILRENRNLNEN